MYAHKKTRPLSRATVKHSIGCHSKHKGLLPARWRYVYDRFTYTYTILWYPQDIYTLYHEQFLGSLPMYPTSIRTVLYADYTSLFRLTSTRPTYFQSNFGA